MSVIEVEGLRKEYRNGVVAVDSLDIHIDGPGVYGFLGPNGSGKTTTIRCLLGLIRPTRGRVRLHGVDVMDSLASVIDRVGALVETPKFFPTFSGRKNLVMLGNVKGLAKSDVDRSLEMVGLSDRADDRFSTYSLGMKQRLAVAATLMKDPDLIILDEPANGLDPAGIVEIRQLIRSLGAEGKTIFVSSHQLGEVQQTCDRLMIISRGRLITEGSVDEVVRAGSSESLVVTIEDVSAAIVALTAAGLAARQGEEVGTLLVDVGAEHGPRVTKILADADLYLGGLRSSGASLESVFLNLTDGEGSL